MESTTRYASTTLVQGGRDGSLFEHPSSATGSRSVRAAETEAVCTQDVDRPGGCATRPRAALAFCGLILAAISGNVFAQAGISTQPGTMTGTIGSNKGAVGAVQCPAGTLLSGVLHRDINMAIPPSDARYNGRGMTGQVSLYCSRISTDGTAVSVQQTTLAGTPAVNGYNYSDSDITQHAYCPSGQIAHQMGGWDRITEAAWPWVSALRLACRPLQLNANSWVRVNTSVPVVNVDAGNRETNGTHVPRGPFCDAGSQTTIVAGYHRQAGGVGYDGINVYCGGLLQARLSAVLTFTDFAWDKTLGGGGWLVDLGRGGVTLNDGGGNDGTGRTPHASVAANSNVFQPGWEIYVLPNSGYGARISQRPVGVVAASYVQSGSCVNDSLTLANEQDGSCHLNVHGLPDIAVGITTSSVAYSHHGQTYNVTVSGTNLGPGAVAATDGFTLVTTLPLGWTATPVPGCTVVGQQVTCAISTTLAAATAPDASGDSVQFTFPVTVNAPTASGTYPATVVLGRDVPDGDSDPTNDDFNTANDTAADTLILMLEADLQITKTNTPEAGTIDQTDDAVLSGTQTTYAIVVRNNGPAELTNTVLRDTPEAGLSSCVLESPACEASGAATCPAVGVAAGQLSMANLQASAPNGVLIPTLGNGGEITIRVACAVD